MVVSSVCSELLSGPTVHPTAAGDQGRFDPARHFNAR